MCMIKMKFKGQNRTLKLTLNNNLLSIRFDWCLTDNVEGCAVKKSTIPSSVEAVSKCTNSSD